MLPIPAISSRQAPRSTAAGRHRRRLSPHNPPQRGRGLSWRASPWLARPSRAILWLALLAELGLPTALLAQPATVDPAPSFRAAAATTLPLPCPLSRGWRVHQQLELPRRDALGQPLGGFSAAHYDAENDRLWLLSDLPEGELTIWSGLADGGAMRLQRRIALRRQASLPGPQPADFDAEGLVLVGDQAWLVSEANLASGRPAELLRLVSGSGEVQQSLPLPLDWQPADGRGLRSNGGPESLLRLPDGAGSAPRLLLAGEFPLQQDPERQVRLLEVRLPTGPAQSSAAPQIEERGWLLLPPGGDWGLTDLLAVAPERLLGLLRQFEAPDRWRIRLALYPLPRPGERTPQPALASWDLLHAGLNADNWEGLSLGPRLADGRRTLLLVSDDNLNPLQANRLALLVPEGEAGGDAMDAAAACGQPGQRP